MSEPHDIHKKLHTDNGHYVALLSRSGSKILMSKVPHGNVRMLTLDTGPCSPMCSEGYRKAVCNSLGFSRLGTHVIEAQEFRQYSLNHIGEFVSLTIIETTSDDSNVESPLLWIDWKQNDAVFSSTTEPPAASHYLRSFLDNLESQIQKTRHFPWYCFGYYRRILPVLMKHLQEFGYVIEGQPEQVNFSFHSSTYRIPSKTGDLFFKACLSQRK